ncbi:MAG: protein phosphatase 2C domain-containing protein [Leptolyngbyaceae cyanobacterium MO_188.B28]|nr:protein phosphatase 2C domain-containing protein [Leptolyngbyaceae cyanobacterium MO_188.B28]
MTQHFEVAAGSILGRDHLRVGKNNQDAFSWISREHVTLAIVCDGCGSGAASEVGAQIGAQLIIEAIAQQLEVFDSIATADFWRTLHQEVLSRLQSIVLSLRGPSWQTIRDYLLFTVVGGLITPETTVVFGLGDGVFALNGEVQTLGPFPDNAPPYLAYGLTAAAPMEQTPSPLQFQVYRQIPTDTLESLLLGSDGVADLMAAAARSLPGSTDTVGPLSQFWQCDRYFANSHAVRRRLALINREVVRPNWQARQLTRHVGLLPDDTTLVTIRRRSA